MKKIIFLISFCGVLISCGDLLNSEIVDSEVSSRSDSFSPKDRQELFPNPLFIALVDQEDQAVLQEMIDENGQYLFDKNRNGDTALAVAIQFYNLEGALFVAEQLSPQHLFETNNQGESYLYLASQQGYVKLIQALSTKFYDSERFSFLSDYEFSDLDKETLDGERSLHIAKNYVTAEALKYEYWRGLEYPMRKFQYLQNKEGQTFLHTSIRDQNRDLLFWGVENNCMKKEEWEHQKSYYKYPMFVWKGIQKYGKSIHLDWDDVINTQDNQGMTPVNFAAKNAYLEALDILSTCQWVDYILPDHQGNIPLQNLLLTLNPSNKNHSEEIKKSFTLLMESQTRLTWLGISDQVNFVNQKGDSSLHIAARFSDPFFYEQLKKYGDREQENHEGHTPKEIFESTRKNSSLF